MLFYIILAVLLKNCTDQDSFLPSSIQRYHQLFMPALQVVNGILATLGPKHATAANQALEFLSNHRDTVVILLKTDMGSMPLAFMEEVHLLVTLCGIVLPLVPKSELLSPNSGFGAIHAVILSLSTRCLGHGNLLESVRPQSDAEALDATTFASGP
jgi:nuclear pore complex protein Nup205